MMTTKTTSILVILLILAATVVGAILYPSLPERMASHWNTQNQVDGYISRFWGVFMLPVIAVGLYLLFLVIPLIDPLRDNIAKFRGTFNTFILLLVAFLVYIYLLSLGYNLGYKINIGQAMLPALGVFTFYAGVLMGKAKRNWFIGIRTPWTLSNEVVWEKTHRLGAMLFKACGIVMIASTFFADYAYWVVIIPLLGSALFLVIYSYLLYCGETNKVKQG
jgi:uncharacterized membrane protein